MAAARKKPPKATPAIRPGVELGDTDGEPTLIGRERSKDVSRRRLILEREIHGHRLRERAVLGLMLLLGAVLPLGSLAMIGVAAGWFPWTFALQVLAMTLTPLFAVWLLVIRWAFRRDARR